MMLKMNIDFPQSVVMHSDDKTCQLRVFSSNNIASCVLIPQEYAWPTKLPTLLSSLFLLHLLFLFSSSITALFDTNYNLPPKNMALWTFSYFRHWHIQKHTSRGQQIIYIDFKVMFLTPMGRLDFKIRLPFLFNHRRPI